MMPDGPRNTSRKLQAQRQTKHKEMGKEGFFFSWLRLAGFTSLGSVLSRHIRFVKLLFKNRIFP